MRMSSRKGESPHVYENERNVVCIEYENQSAYVVQIADQIVSAIECYVELGDAAARPAPAAGGDSP